MLTRLAVWSGPRNISTALLRSWENRSDSVVVDEPLYAHYLQVTGVDHPGREEVIAVGETDWRRVVSGLLGPQLPDVRVFYQKHMAHHLTTDVERDWVEQLSNVLLIRDPAEVVASYLRSRDRVAVADLGLVEQVQLFEELTEAGSPPLIVDSGDFLRRPEAYLRTLCDELGLEFEPAMLSWPAGPRDSDGVWAPYWYDAVWRSTGFEEYRPREVQLDELAQEVVDACRPMYQMLHGMRLVLPVGDGAGQSLPS